MKYAGNDGVAAYGVIMYVNMIFIAIFFGYCMGTSPIIGYNYGSKNTDELKNIFKKSMVLMTLVSVMMFIGRVGLITVAMSLFKRKQNTNYRLPEENVIIN